MCGGPTTGFAEIWLPSYGSHVDSAVLPYSTHMVLIYYYISLYPYRTQCICTHSIYVCPFLQYETPGSCGKYTYRCILPRRGSNFFLFSFSLSLSIFPLILIHIQKETPSSFSTKNRNLALSFQFLSLYSLYSACVYVCVVCVFTLSE